MSTSEKSQLAVVVPLFGFRNSRSLLDAKKKKEKDILSFQETMQLNKSNSERLRQSRLKANDSVLKTYKLKKS